MLLPFVPPEKLWPRLHATSLNSAFTEWDKAKFSNVNIAKPKESTLAKEKEQRQSTEPKKLKVNTCS